MKKSFLQSLIIASIFIFALLSACTNTPAPYRFLSEHPEELEKSPPKCSDCHDPGGEIPHAQFNHRGDYINNHRLIAHGNQNVCNMCHKPNFCSDCHGVEVELKPSLRNQSDTYRKMIHRGDYMSRHTIEGRINPIPCFGCHGNPRRSGKCVLCHQ
jgi:hypothetical protein